MDLFRMIKGETYYGEVLFYLGDVTRSVAHLRQLVPYKKSVLLARSRLGFVTVALPLGVAAAVIGRRFGRHAYRILGATRTWEGSFAMFAFSFVALLLAQSLFSPEGADPERVLRRYGEGSIPRRKDGRWHARGRTCPGRRERLYRLAMR